MSIEIQYVKERGNLSKERVILRVTEDDDIGRYILFDTTFHSDGTVSNEVRHSLWFPDKSVRRGDLVVAYTKVGTNSEKRNENGSTSHFFYMGISKTIWNKSNDGVVLIEAKTWQVKKAV